MEKKKKNEKNYLEKLRRLNLLKYINAFMRFFGAFSFFLPLFFILELRLFIAQELFKLFFLYECLLGTPLEETLEHE